MTSLNDFAAECLRLYRSTPDRVPSIAWVELLLRHASDLLTAIQSYSAHLAGRPYRLGILSDPNGTDGCATFAPTMGALNGATARLECQLNPEHRPRGDGGLTATLGVPGGWGDRQLGLLESMGWLRTYLCQVQDAMGWTEQAEGWTVLQGQGRTPGAREVYGDARFITYSVDPETFVWPAIPAGVAPGLEQVVKAVREIIVCCTDPPPQTQLGCSPNVLAGELGVSAGTLNKYAKAHDTSESGNGDDSPYVIASALWRGRFDDYRQFKAWLDKHPQVRNEQRGQRRMVHAADFARVWADENRSAFESLDCGSGPSITPSGEAIPPDQYIENATSLYEKVFQGKRKHQQRGEK